jgi:hypothetical protein
MTISSVKTGAIGDSLLAGNAAFIPTDFESIATATPTSGTSITFSSIPSTYKHLQVRYQMVTNTSFGGSLSAKFNADSGANYARHRLYGDGATATAGGGASATQMWVGDFGLGAHTTSPMGGIIDIHDYASTTKNKTVRTISGVDANGTGGISLLSSLWMSTSAVTSLELFIGADAFKTGSVFSLYGIK